jgi:Kef-type K+ transport system membrane component KefB
VGTVQPMTLRTRWYAVGLVAWTAFVWANRVANVLGGDEATAARVVSFVTAALFLVLAAAAAVVLLTRRRRAVDRAGAGVLLALAVLSIVYWPVRMVQIALGGNSVGFVAVHLVLGVVAVALAWPVAREARTIWLGEPVAR